MKLDNKENKVIDYNFNELFFFQLSDQLNAIRKLKIYHRDYISVCGELRDIYSNLYNPIKRHDPKKLKLIEDNLEDAQQKIYNFRMASVRKQARRAQASALSKSQYEMIKSVDLLQRNLIACIDDLGILFKTKNKGDPSSAVMNR